MTTCQSDDVLSVREAVAYLHSKGIPASERHTRRSLSSGTWPVTRTVAGRLGITLADLAARYPLYVSGEWVRE